MQLHSGDRAVVVDPGRHAVTSFGALYRAKGRRPARPRRGVVIRLPGGGTLEVPRRDLELLAPEHPLAPEPDGSHADWFLSRLASWRGARVLTVASFVPRELPAVACVLHPWFEHSRGVAQPIRWSRVMAEEGMRSHRELVEGRDDTSGTLEASRYGQLSPGELDPLTAQALVEVLRGFTATPADVFFGVWTGWGDIPTQRFPGAAGIATEGRGHFLLRGPLEGALTSVAVHGQRPVSGMWWPADRSWLVVTEVDFAWTFVGGSQEMVERLTGSPALETLRTGHDNPAHLPGEPPPPGASRAGGS